MAPVLVHIDQSCRITTDSKVSQGPFDPSTERLSIDSGLHFNEACAHSLSLSTFSFYCLTCDKYLSVVGERECVCLLGFKRNDECLEYHGTSAQGMASLSMNL